MPLTDQLRAANIVLPPVNGPFGAYVPAKRVGQLIYVAGQLPMRDGALMATGQVPSRRSVDEAIAAARQCAINALAAVQMLDGGVDQITGVARVGVFVSSDTMFTDQPKIANGASEFFMQILGDAGQHARAAVGVNTLPRDASVEVEVIFECR